MSTVKSSVTVENVTRLRRPGVGYVYRAIVPVLELYRLVHNAVLRYAPRYQRGFATKHLDEMDPADYDKLLPINDKKLQVNAKRAQEMAAKYIMGAVEVGETRLFSSNVIWNARTEQDVPEPVFDGQQHKLTISSSITIPDTGHRHLAYYLVGLWKEYPETIPQTVLVNEEEISRAQIDGWLDNVDLSEEENYSVYVDIYTLDKISEGELFDEFNADAKPPSRAVGLDLNRRKTPSRRFVWRLIESCLIFSDTEVETRSNTIGAKSRKLTTTSTMERAIHPFTTDLIELEKEPRKYDDLIEFFCAFYHEWAMLYPAFQPGTSFEERKSLRDSSFASANLMFFPMFRIAFELWQSGIDWKVDNSWKNALARMGGATNVTNDKGIKTKLNLMDRENADWHGKILIRTFDQDGNEKGWSLSSTRQTREAAYHYLRQKAKLKLKDPKAAQN